LAEKNASTTAAMPTLGELSWRHFEVVQLGSSNQSAFAIAQCVLMLADAVGSGQSRWLIGTVIAMYEKRGGTQVILTREGWMVDYTQAVCIRCNSE
jgi:hypothetical protein